MVECNLLYIYILKLIGTRIGLASHSSSKEPLDVILCLVLLLLCYSFMSIFYYD